MAAVRSSTIAVSSMRFICSTARFLPARSGRFTRLEGWACSSQCSDEFDARYLLTEGEIGWSLAGRPADESPRSVEDKTMTDLIRYWDGHGASPEQLMVDDPEMKSV